MKKIFLYCLPLLLFLASCSATSSVSVSTDYDKGTNFAVLKTFKWYQDKPSAERETGKDYDTFLDQRVKNAVESGLLRKGLQQTTGTPDIYVAYDVSVATRQEVRPDYYYPGFGYGYGYWYGYRYNYGYNRFASPPLMIDQYQEGTLVLDLIDAKDNQLIWRGYGQMTVGGPSISQDEVNKIVSRILEKYPPGSGR